MVILNTISANATSFGYNFELNEVKGPTHQLLTLLFPDANIMVKSVYLSSGLMAFYSLWLVPQNTEPISQGSKITKLWRSVRL